MLERFRVNLAGGFSMTAVLLAGTSLNLTLVAPAQAQQRTPESITIIGRKDDYKVDAPSLTKFTEPLIDTPQTIDVISQQLMGDKAITNMNDALRTIPGITLGAGEFSWQGNNPNIRGFNARTDMFIDGMRDFGNYSRDPFDLEKIEVLEGPAGLDFGRGSTGGIINQVSKQASLVQRIAGALNFGTDLTRRGTVDINDPLPELAQGAALRLNIMGHESEVAGRDVVKSRRYGFAPTLALGLGTDTRFTLSYFHQSNDDIPDYGLPWFGTFPAPVNRHNYYGFKDDYVRTDADVVSARAEHDFNDMFSLSGQIRYGHYSRNVRITEPLLEATVVVPPAGQTGTPAANAIVDRNVFTGPSVETDLDAQTDLTAHFSTGPVTHAVVTGIEGGRERSNPSFGFGVGVPTTSLFTPNEATPYTATSAFPRLVADTTGNSFGTYVLDTAKITDYLQLMGGVRWDYFNANYGEVRFTVPGAVLSTARYDHTDKEFSYRAGVVAKPMSNGTVYFTFSTSFDPSAETLSFITSGRGLGIGNVFLDPEKNHSYEIGTKWEFLNSNILVNAAVFRTDKINARIPSSTPGFNILGGNFRADGVSAGVTGRITSEWQVIASYTYLDTEVRKSAPGGPPVGSVLPYAPKNAFNAWTTYEITSAIEVGAGAQFVGTRYAQVTNPIRIAPHYWTFDAMAKYQYSQHIALKVNVTNIGNKYFYDGIHPFHVVPGEGRTAMFAINVTY